MNQNDFQKNLQNVYCDYSVDKNSIYNFTILQSYVRRGLCTAYTVPMAVLLGRCVPGKLIDASNSITGNYNLTEFKNQFSSLVFTEEQIVSSKGVVDKITKVF